MFSQVARRLAPSLGLPTNMFKLPTLMASMYRVSRGGVTATTSTRFSASPVPRMGNAFPSILSRSVGPISSSGARPSLRLSTRYSLESTNGIQGRGFASKKHKRVIKQSKGFRGRANRCFRIAIRRLEKSWQYAYRDRKVKKREFRKLWIQRVNAGVRQHGVSYSNFIAMQNRSGVVLDRKILSGLAMYEPFSFKAVVDVVQKMSATGAGK